MLFWLRSLDVAEISILIVTLYIAIHFAKLRKKSTYKVFSIGIGMLVGSEVIRMIEWLTSPLFNQFEWLIQYISNSLEWAGWYIATIGLVMLHRVLSKRSRWSLFAASFIWVAIALLPYWIGGLFTGLVYATGSIYIERWIAHSRKLVVWLFRIITISQLLSVLERVPVGEFLHSISGVIQETSQWIGMCLALLILIGRVSDALETSHKSSITDGLTGLYNRKYIYGFAQKYVDRGIEVAVVFFDLDNFKKLNDTQGHEAGDEALKVVASILKDEAESKGIAGRYGGEEMVVLVTKPETDMEEFSEQVRQRIEKESVVTASIGFATWVRGITTEELLNRADEAMYHSKTSGKNRVTGYKN